MPESPRQKSGAPVEQLASVPRVRATEQDAQSVASGWPGFIWDEWTTIHVRRDQLHRATEFAEYCTGPLDDEGLKIVSYGERVMVRDPEWGYSEGMLEPAEPGVEHDDAAVYVQFEVCDAV